MVAISARRHVNSLGTRDGRISRTGPAHSGPPSPRERGCHWPWQNVARHRGTIVRISMPLRRS